MPEENFESQTLKWVPGTIDLYSTKQRPSTVNDICGVRRTQQLVLCKPVHLPQPPVLQPASWLVLGGAHTLQAPSTPMKTCAKNKMLTSVVLKFVVKIIVYLETTQFQCIGSIFLS
jgi:hypothetical protein